MRRKPSGQSGFNNNQRHKQRFSSGGSGSNHGGNNRPRKNYSSIREKYLQQARDALAAGDRVLAENYFQHADHCFRMLAEEQASRPQPRPQHANEQQSPEQQSASEVLAEEDEISSNSSALPAFLKVNYEQTKQENPPPLQDWEERDQG